MVKVEQLIKVLKEKKLVVFTFCLWLLVSCSVFLAGKYEWKDAMEQPYVSKSIGTILRDNSEIISLDEQEISQDIEVDRGEFSGFSLYVTAEDSRISGILKVVLVDKKSGETIKKWLGDMKEIKLDGYFNFMLDDPIKNSDKNVYSVRIQMENKSEVVPQLTLITEEKNIDANLMIDGKKNKKMMPYRILDGYCASLKYFLYALYFGMSLLLAVLCYMLMKKRRIEWIFAISVVIVGAIYLFLIPPFVVPDEASHFVTVYAHSSELMGMEAVDSDGNVMLPSDTLWGENKHLATRDTYLQFMKGALGKDDSNSGNPIAPRKPLSYFNPGYFPQIIGVSLGRILGVNDEQLLLLGRVAALAWYCFIMFWTIKLMPFGKTAMFIIGMLPMTMQQVVSYSYDSILLGLCFLGIAYLLYLIYTKEKIERRDIIIVLVITVLIAIIKFAYLLILGLALVIPPEKFGGTKKKRSMALLVIATSVASIMCTKISYIQKLAASSPSAPGGRGTKMSISFCFQHPVEIVEMIYRTLERQLTRWLEEMLASPLGYLELVLPDIIVIALIIIILLSVLPKEGEKYCNIATIKSISVLIAAGVAALVMTAMLLDWTTIEATQIEGIQGRYFLPVLPLIVILSQNNMIVMKKNIDYYLIIIMGYIHCMTAFFVSLKIVGR